MLFTGKGDDGKTNLYGCSERVSKASKIAEALGSVDEINSLLGVCKARARDEKLSVGDLKFEEIVDEVQQNLFILQAELAGFDKTIAEEKVKKMEKLIGDIENHLPLIRSFFVSGATETSAFFDFARTVARRAERRIVEAKEEKEIGKFSYAYANRLSSLLYALARLAAQQSGASEEKPTYK